MARLEDYLRKAHKIRSSSRGTQYERKYVFHICGYPEDAQAIDQNARLLRSSEFRLVVPEPIGVKTIQDHHIAVARYAAHIAFDDDFFPRYVALCAEEELLGLIDRGWYIPDSFSRKHVGAMVNTPVYFGFGRWKYTGDFHHAHLRSSLEESKEHVLNVLDPDRRRASGTVLSSSSSSSSSFSRPLYSGPETEPMFLGDETERS